MSIGPEWGNAHIEVHADTSPMRRELRAAAAVAGKEFGQDFGDAADSSLGKELSLLGRHIEAALKKQGRAGGTDFGDAFEDGVRRRLQRFDMNIIESALSGDWSFAVEQFGSLDKAIAGLNAKFLDLRQNSDLSSDAMLDMEGSARSFFRQLREGMADEEFDKIREAAERLNAEFDKTTTANAQQEYKDLGREAKALHVEINKMLKAHDDEDRALSRSRDRAHELAFEFQRVAAASKKAREDFSLFGRLRGSRNNFLNLLGGMSRAVEHFGDGLGQFLLKSGPAVVNWAKGVGDAFATFGDVIKVGKADGIGAGISALGEKFSLLSSALAGGRQGGVPGLLVSAAAGIIQIGQAVAGVVLAIGSLNIIAPAITGLAGIVTALAGSLSYALAGFLLPLGPMALAAAAGVGALAVAFAGAGDEIDEFAKPFKDWIEELRPLVQKELFKTLARDLDRFKSVLNNFVGPLLISSASALSGVFDYFVTAMTRPDVQNTMRILGETLPSILGSLGRGFTDFLTGMLGFFAPISVYVTDIAQKIADMAFSFSEWANSAAGQTAIGDFFAAASASAQILWDLIVNVGGAIGTLFAQGKETGDGFLSKISEIIAEFTVWANSEEGRAKIAGWMQFAKDLAGELWAAIETVGSMIAKLDTPANRSALLALIGAFTQILDAIGKVARDTAFLAPAFETAFKVIGALAQSAADLIGKVASAIEGLTRALGRITVPQALRTIADLASKISGTGIKFPGMASGGILTGPKHILAGEDGPEAVVPLDRNLNMVDPSVRWLSAIAQGKGGGMAGQGSGGSGRSIVVAEGAFQVITPTRDPVQVTHMVLDGLVAATF